MSDEPKPSNETSDDDPHREQRERDFQRYWKERDEWVKAMLDAERSYDTLLVTISTLALGASLTKDWVAKPTGLGDFFLVLAWTAFAACLGLSLLHRYWTHYTHQTWISECDKVFKEWTPDVWERCDTAYNNVPKIKVVESVKMWAGIAVAVGIASSFCLLIVERYIGPKAAPTPGQLPFSQTINVYPPATQPTTQQVNP